MNKEQYKKLYVLSPNYYEKLKKQQTKLVSNQPLDQTLIKIIQSKQPNYYKKWLMYKNALIKFKEQNDKNSLKLPKPMKEEKPKEEKNVTFNTSNFKNLLRREPSYFWDSEFYKHETPVITKPSRKSVTFFTNDRQSNSDLFNTYRKQDSSFDNTTTDNDSSLNFSIENIFDSTKNPQEQEDVFEHDPEYDPNLQNNEILQNNSNQSTNEAVEHELYELARQSFKEPNTQNILRLDSTLNESYRAFENRKTRDLVAIEVAPVKNSIEKNVPLSLRTEEAPRPDVSPIIHDIDDYTSEEHQPKLIRLAKNPISSPVSSNLHARSLRARNRSMKRKTNEAQSKQPKKSKKGDKKIHQPQQGMGFQVKWERLSQKHINRVV